MSIKTNLISYLNQYLLRLNQFVIFNGLRMYIYKQVLKIPVGKNTMIWAGNKFNNIQKLTIGSHSIIGPQNLFLIRGGLKIGDNVNISGFSHFISQGHEIDNPDYKTKYASIIIDDYAWIAVNSTILAGITIGKGAVVASGSIVTKNVKPYTVVAGNPAKQISNRAKNLKYTLNGMKGIKWL